MILSEILKKRKQFMVYYLPVKMVRNSIGLILKVEVPYKKFDWKNFRLVEEGKEVMSRRKYNSLVRYFVHMNPKESIGADGKIRRRIEYSQTDMIMLLKRDFIAVRRYLRVIGGILSKGREKRKG